MPGSPLITNQPLENTSVHETELRAEKEVKCHNEVDMNVENELSQIVKPPSDAVLTVNQEFVTEQKDLVSDEYYEPE